MLSSTQIACVEVPLTGGKGSSLAILNTIAKVTVPEFFCVTTNAFRRTVASGGLAEAVVELQRLSDEWLAEAVTFQPFDICLSVYHITCPRLGSCVVCKPRQPSEESQQSLDEVFQYAAHVRELINKLPPPKETVHTR